MKAIFNHITIAESNEAILFEGSTYFPPGSIVSRYFKQTAGYTTNCPLKGEAVYYTIDVNGETREHAGWVYHDPTPAAGHIKGYFAFWKGIKIEES